jgi:hypothetical protein
MHCHAAQLMGCPKCGEVFCVPAVVGRAEVFHAPCGVALTLQLVEENVDLVTRAVVVWSREHNAFEVAIGGQG